MTDEPPRDQPTHVLAKELLPASTAIFTTIALASFEGLAVAAALPEIAGALGGVELLPWVITAFLLTSGVATVVSGPLVDAVGVSRMFRYAVSIFASAGFLAAFAPNMGALVALRTIQGVGAGFLLSTGIAAVALVFPDHLVGRAYAANATIWGIMGVAGPGIAAAMLTFLSWRWIFLVNLPLGTLSLLAGWRVLPGPVGEDAAHIDIRGTLLVTAASVATLFAVDALGVASLLWLLVVGVAVWMYVIHARSVARPVVRLEHLFVQPYSGLAAGTGLMLAGAIAVNAYLPLYVQAGRGASPGLTAWSVLFFTLGWTLGANIGSRLLDRHSESWITLVGFFFTVPALAVIWFTVSADAGLPWIFAAFLVAGIGVGFTTNAGLTLVRAVTLPAQIGRVSAAYQFARNQGFTYGAAIGGAVLLVVVAGRVGDVEAVRALLAGDTDSVSGSVAEAVRAGFAAAAVGGTAMAALGVVFIVAMRRSLAEARAAKRGTPRRD